MLLLAEELQDNGIRNIAVAAIDEPTFVGKSRKLRKAISQQLSNSNSEGDTHFNLYFLLGWDTVIRLFQPRFYHDSPTEMAKALSGFFGSINEGDDESLVVCARRPSSGTDEEELFLQSEGVRPFYEAGKVTMIDLPVEVRTISSTEVRTVMSASGEDVNEELQRLTPRRVSEYVLERRLYLPTESSS